MKPKISKNLKRSTITEARSIEKISTERGKVVKDMKELAAEYSQAKKSNNTERQSEILKQLKELTAKKAKLEKELDAAVLTKDKDVELAIEENLLRAAVRRIVRETVDSQSPTNLVSEVEKFFNANKKKLEKLADEDDWDNFYELAYEKFPEIDQDKVAQALNRVCMQVGWFEEEDVTEIPSEKELQQMAFGDKSQQKGIKMGDYDKKNKSPKQSPSELFAESKKKDSAETIEEAEYRGRKVKLGKPFYTPEGPRKRAVYVRNDKGNVVKVGFGDPNMKIKKSNPARRKSFRARHNCDNPGPRHKARYWSCKFW